MENIEKIARFVVVRVAQGHCHREIAPFERVRMISASLSQYRSVSMAISCTVSGDIAIWPKIPNLNLKKEYYLSLPSVGPGADPGVQAVKSARR